MSSQVLIRDIHHSNVVIIANGTMNKQKRFSHCAIPSLATYLKHCNKNNIIMESV